MNTKKILILTTIITFLYVPTLLFASDSTMIYIHNAPESVLDKRYTYHWEILRTALEKTKKKFGSYKLVSSKIMTEKRQAFELMNKTNQLTVMVLDTKPEFEKNLIGIHIPIDKGIVGYRVFLIRKEMKNEFRRISFLNDFHKYSFGLGLEWIDVDILRNSKFNVVTGSNYEGLFDMLLHKRFDIFLRSAVESLDEVEQRKHKMPELFIEESLCLYYPLPIYFWFSKTNEGKRLASRAEEGMRIMIADGTYDKIFNKYYQDKIKELHLKERKMFRIENPFLVRETPLKDKSLWFDPQTYSVQNNPN